MTDPHVIADPYGLLQSGEPLASTTELAAMFGCSGRRCEPCSAACCTSARFVHYRPGPPRYCVADVRSAFEPCKTDLEARRQRAAER